MNFYYLTTFIYEDVNYSPLEKIANAIHCKLYELFLLTYLYANQLFAVVNLFYISKLLSSIDFYSQYVEGQDIFNIFINLSAPLYLSSLKKFAALKKKEQNHVNYCGEAFNLAAMETNYSQDICTVDVFFSEM